MNFNMLQILPHDCQAPHEERKGEATFAEVYAI